MVRVVSRWATQIRLDQSSLTVVAMDTASAPLGSYRHEGLRAMLTPGSPCCSWVLPSPLIEGASHATAAAVEDVRIDHGRGDVAVAEEFLDGPDVIAGLEEVRGERVAQGVAARRLGESGLAGGQFDESLEHGFVQVMAAALAGLRVDIGAGRGEDPLPAPLARGAGVFASECAGKLDVAPTAPQVFLMLEAHHLEVGAERGPERGGEHGHAVLPSLSIAHDDLAAGHVHVLDAQAAAFHESQAGAVEEAGHEPGSPLDPGDDRVHLRACEDDRKAGSPSGARHALEPFEFPVQDVAVEEHERSQRLVLGRGADAAARGEVREVAGDLALSHLVWVAFAVMEDELPHPADVGLLGPG